MKRLLLGFLACVCATVVHAAPVTIDFEEFDLGAAENGVVSNGYLFTGGHGPGCSMFGCPAEILIGVSGSKSFGAFNGWNGQDGFGATVHLQMRRDDGGAFAIHSLDLYLEGCVNGVTWCGGRESIEGTLAGGGAADLSVAVGTGDWLNLERVWFEAEGGCCDFSDGTVAQIDNVQVSAVPVPAAVWLFGSALAGLGWMRRNPAR